MKDFYQSEAWKIIRALLNERLYSEFLTTKPEETEKREKIHSKVTLVREIEEIMRALHHQAEQIIRESRK